MPRRYELKQRAERQAETRRRIVQAAVELHTTIGPAETSISAIAARARVQRHTVYAHFPDLPSLFEACSAHWRELHPLPDLRSRDLRSALTALYAWYAEVEDAVAVLMRDSGLYPHLWAERERSFDALADFLARQVGSGKLVRAAVGHALAFETWRSLTRRERLTDEQAVDAMLALVEAARCGVRSPGWPRSKGAKPSPAST